MKKKTVVIFLFLFFALSKVFASCDIGFYCVSCSDVRSKTRSSSFLEFVPSACSAVATILSAFIAFRTYKKNKPNIEVRIFFEKSLKSIEIINIGSVRTFVKITNYVHEGNRYTLLWEEKAYFSEISEKWKEVNKKFNKNDAYVHDILYEIEPGEVLGFIVPQEEYDKLSSKNGGFFIRDTSGVFQLCDIKNKKVVKMSEKKCKKRIENKSTTSDRNSDNK